MTKTVNANIDISLNRATGERVPRKSTTILTTQDDYDRYYARMGNRAGTINGAVCRWTTLAELTVHRLLGDGYEPWEIALLLASMGAAMDGGELYSAHLPVDAREDLNRLAESWEYDRGWMLLREWCSVVGSGSHLTQWLEEAYREQWDCDIAWHVGAIPTEEVQAAIMGRVGWWMA